MSKNDEKKNEEKKIEKPEAAVERLAAEIINEAKLIATAQTESCYTLVEKTKELMANEEKL